ncbi:MAG: hypothetical protein MJ238_03080 [Bacilli bacterium]|nr:hypothetical protein [Bacilli bacterium]
MKTVRSWLLLTLIVLSSCNRQTKTSNGCFISIDEAYEKSFISKENVLCIATHYNNRDYTDDKQITTCQLDEDIIRDIKQSHLSRIKKQVSNPSISDVEISNFFGIYGDCIALTINDKYLYCDPIVYEYYAIDGIVFENLIKGYPSGLEIWKKA